MKYFLLLISLNCLGITATESKVLFTKYLVSIKDAKEKDLKALLTKKYLKDLEKQNYITKMFKENNKSKSSKVQIDFDIKIKKAQNEMNVFFVNIKDKGQKEFGHDWFRVIKKDSQYLIDGSRHLD